MKIKSNLTFSEAKTLLKDLLIGRYADSEIKSILVSLHEKGETYDEIAGFASALREFAEKPYDRGTEADFLALDTVDCCGSGGGISLFNVSSALALLLAASGLYVAKHGNRGITSGFGSADFFEKCGVNIDIPPNKTAEVILKANIGFLYAPNYHKATKRVQAIRKVIPHKTIFNVIGPLSNPAFPKYQVVGLYSEELLLPVARALKAMGITGGAVLFGRVGKEDFMDEVSVFGKTEIAGFSGDISKTDFFPSYAGIDLYDISAYPGFNDIDGTFSAVMEVLSGDIERHKIIADILIANAAVAFFYFDKAGSYEEGAELAEKVLSDGCAVDVLNKFVKVSNEV